MTPRSYRLAVPDDFDGRDAGSTVEVYHSPTAWLPFSVSAGRTRRASFTESEAWGLWALLTEALHATGEPPGWALDVAAPG